MALKMLKPLLKVLDIRSVQPLPKYVDKFYSSPEWKQTRLEILKRDNFTCVLCGDRAIIADHIISRRNGGTEDHSNLRSLCRVCDSKIKEGPSGTRNTPRKPSPAAR